MFIGEYTEDDNGMFFPFIYEKGKYYWFGYNGKEEIEKQIIFSMLENPWWDRHKLKTTFLTDTICEARYISNVYDGYAICIVGRSFFYKGTKEEVQSEAIINCINKIMFIYGEARDK